MRTFGKVVKWLLRIVGVAAALVVVVVGSMAIAWEISGRNLLPWQEPEIVEVEKEVPAECHCEVCEECPECPASAAGPVEPVVPAGPAESDMVDLVEIGTGEAVAAGLKDPEANPTVTLEPGQGILWSSDPGGANVAGQIVDYETKGSMGYIYNNSGQTINVIFHTGWNTENERWNISPVLFEVNELSALREHTLTINQDEQKPLFFGLIFDGSNLISDPAL